ncbi:MAG TPA: transporter substrate-binding domain-containing protein [Casimicrobiaceae bacterium]|jgi:membrane-bound lytic murein transglycosylase MltF
MAFAIALPAATFAQSPPDAKVFHDDDKKIQVGTRPWKGDFDQMKKRRIIRALVPYSKTFYYVENGRQRGISYEVFQAFEDDLNKRLKSKTLKIRVLYLPVGRDEIVSRLADGWGDVVFADLTITPERQKRADFSAPMYSGIKEIVVTGPGGPQVDSLDDLSGKEVFIRRNTSYYEHLQELNQRLTAAGKAPVKIRAAPEELEAEDILEMVNSGLIGATVVDRYKAVMWARVFKNLELHNDVPLHDGAENAFMLRKGSPQLKAALDDFVKRHGQGTTFGNSIVNRYVKNPKFVKNALGDDERKRFGATVGLFRKYGDKYELDYLLMMAQAFQESGLDQNAKSAVGAIGVMQIMPATGKDLKVGDITQLEPNVHGGVKYIRFMIDQFYKDEPMTPLNKGLFAFASYNAGPGRVAQLRREATKRGLDPNRWFNNVELVAADRIGPETVNYVSNIYKYYTAYTLLIAQDEERRKARESVTAPR